MKLSQAFAFLAFVGAKRLLSNKTLKWETVNGWIEANSNIDDLGRGEFGMRLGSGSNNSYADVRKGRTTLGKIQVTASVVFNARQGPATSKSWEVDKLDSKLDKKFGDGQHFRVSI